MNSLFDAKSESLMLKVLGAESLYAVLQRSFSGSIPQNENELSIVDRFAKISPLTISELAKRSDIAINARLP